MKTSIKNLDKCQVKLTVTLDADEIAAITKEVEKTFLREAELPGFRKGKVPIELIRKSFGDGLSKEIRRAMFHKYYGDAIKAEKLDEVALANVEDFKVDAEGGSFVATVEVKPKFKLPTYKGLKIASNDTTVPDEVVKAQLDRLRTAYAKYEDAKEGDVVGDGDFVQIDYDGKVGKQKIVDVNPEAKVVGEGRGFWVQVEEGRFLPEILDAVKGMKAGETKEGVAAKFGKEAAPEGLKGKKAVYTITLKSFRRRILPTDAEFVEKAKAESLDALTSVVRTELQKAADRQEAVRRENEAIELLLKKADFDVPETQVRNATDAKLHDFAQRAQYSGLDASYFEENRDKILEDANTTALKQVRLWYIIDAIAEAEKIGASDEERGRKVIDFVLANAKK
ncbi:MAG: trigger factor [Kiritimatiellae bacterium]|nr:trigger factor [Kiritimatiellia bacterium]